MMKKNTKQTRTIDVCFSGQLNQVEIEGERSLFSICKELKLPIPFSCRIGECGVCKIKINKGIEHISSKTTEEKEFTSDEFERLACQCYITGGIEFERY